MKHFLSYSLLICVCLLFSNCKTKKYTPEDFPDNQITFGSGGGFTGEMVCHHLLQNGQIFKQDGRKANNVELEAIKKDEATSYFTKVDNLNINTLKMKEPGDLYYFIECKEEGKVNRVTWGNPDLPVPEDLEAFYQELCKLVEGRNIATNKK